MFRLAIIHSPQKDILRRMFHVDELQDLGTVALVLQKLRTQRIGVQRRHPLFDQAVMQHRLQQIIFYLLIQFMLAARHGKDDLRAPAHGLFQRIVRSGITGMKRHHHIYVIHALIGRNITMIELQLIVAVMLCQPAAMADDILL